MALKFSDTTPLSEVYHLEQLAINWNKIDRMVNIG